MRHQRFSVIVDGVDGRPLAGADIDVVDPSVARASLYVEAGHLPTGTRTRLVDAVFDSPQICTHQYLQVTMPLGDTEILDRVRERSDAGKAHAAGSTCLFYAVLAVGQVPNRG
jgi:hypothetical protein